MLKVLNSVLPECAACFKLVRSSISQAFLLQIQNTLPIGNLDSSFIILHQYLLVAIKIEGTATVRYAEEVLLVKICDILEQLGLVAAVREGSQLSCCFLQMTSFSFASMQTRINLKYC